jgi:hypothetical protein
MLDLALDNKIFINDKLDAAIQELDLIFNTENTELIGYPQYGTNWLQFLWRLNPSGEDLKKYIYEKIQDSFFLNQFNVDITVNILEDTVYECIYQVMIKISDGNEEKIRVYNIK